jgi:hypothetical protein
MLNNNELVEKIKAVVEENSSAEARQLREKVRDLTLAALQERRLSLEDIRAVAADVAKGIEMGLDRRGGEVRETMREAVAGMDDAMSKAAEAVHLALRQLHSQAKDFSSQELNQSLDTLKSLETEFLDAARQAVQSANGRFRQELGDLFAHLKTAGTDTGTEVRATLESFRNQVGVTGNAVAAPAREFGLRLVSLAGGILAGMREHAKHDKP